MAKVYTAQEMREMANREKFKCSFVTMTLNGGIILNCTSDVCAMLRQAADALERDTLIKELADALDSELDADCQTCGNHSCFLKDEFVCPDVSKNKELVKRAREVLNVGQE